MIKELVVFTYSNCKYCNSLKDRLNDNDIRYFDFDVVKNRSEWVKIIEKDGTDIIPSVYIKGNDDEKGKLYQPGRDFKDENEIFEIIKSYLDNEKKGLV